MQQSMKEFEHQQEQINSQIRELITRLNRQVFQIVTNSIIIKETSLSNFFVFFSGILELTFLYFMAKLCRDEIISVNNSLKWRAL